MLITELLLYESLKAEREFSEFLIIVTIIVKQVTTQCALKRHGRVFANILCFQHKIISAVFLTQFVQTRYFITF